MPIEIPYPITFNPYKHHLQFLLSELERWKKCDWKEVYSDLQKIGSNLTDFYYGNLSIREICSETLKQTHKRGIKSRQKLADWTGPRAWRTIFLSDKSEWMIKSSNNICYLHIHPAKHALHTQRIRAGVLKTVLALNSKGIVFDENNPELLHTVNHIRKNLLQLSPIKEMEMQHSAILRLWPLFIV